MPTRTRPPVVQDAIIEHLRSRIISGKLSPGDRLPPRAEIEKRFKTSTVTVQRAFDRLIDYGFVVARGRQGTFVVPHPPHLYRYALAFPETRGGAGWVRFWTVLTNVARELEQSSDLSIPLYHALDRSRPNGDLSRLVDDIEQKRVAGVIFPTNPFLVEGTRILEEPDLPRVAVMSKRMPGVASIELDRRSFVDKALDHFAARGRKRIALLTVPGVAGTFVDSFVEGLQKRKMTTRDWLIQTALQSEPRWSTNVVRLMLRCPAAERPDGLLITDDNLVEHACQGVIAAGLTVPDDLAIVAHCNYPAPVPSVLPVQRLGYDIRNLLRTCIDVAGRLRAGKRIRSVTMLPAVFESELNA